MNNHWQREDGRQRQDGLSQVLVRLALFAVLATGVLLGGLLFVVLSLSAFCARAVRRVLPSSRLAPETRGRDDDVIEGTYTVIDDGLPPRAHGRGATGH